jgi:hypothetical protein
MRQVLIQKNESISDLANDRVVLLSDERTLPEIKGSGVTLVRFPLKMSVIAGGSINIKFELSKQLAKNGAMLLGAFYEEGEVEAIFMSSSGSALQLKNKTPVLVGTLVETVRYRQIDPGDGVKIVGSTTGQPKKKKKKT